jgi:hypothetical protein
MPQDVLELLIIDECISFKAFEQFIFNDEASPSIFMLAVQKQNETDIDKQLNI